MAASVSAQRRWTAILLLALILDVSILAQTAVSQVSITVNPAALSFGAVVLGSSAEQSLTINNDAAAVGNLTGSITENSIHYSVTAGASFSIAPGASHTVRVAFQPQTSGSLFATLSIFHNAGNVSTPLTVAMDGTGATPNFLVWVGPTAGQAAANSGDSLATALAANGENAFVTPNLFALGTDLSIYEGIFVVLGIFSGNHVISASDPEGPALETYLQNGGFVYVEGGDCFNYDPGQGGYNIRSWFDLNPGNDGSSTLFGLNGVNDLNTFAFTYSGSNNDMDELQPASSIPVWKNSNTDSVHGVFNPTFGSGRAIAAVMEFGGLNNTATGSAMLSQPLSRGYTNTSPKQGRTRRAINPDIVNKFYPAHINTTPRRQNAQQTPNLSVFANRKTDLMAAYLDLFRQSPGPPDILITPSALSDSLLVGGTSSKTFRISNTAGSLASPLNYSITLNGSPGWLTFTPPFGTLNGNESTSIAVQFNAGGLIVGDYTATLQISSNDPDTPVLSLPVALRVDDAPAVGYSPDSLLFTLAPSDSDSAEMLILNSGTGPLTYSLEATGSASPEATRQPGFVPRIIHSPSLQREMLHRSIGNSRTGMDERDSGRQRRTPFPSIVTMGEDVFGSDAISFSGDNRDRGNFFHVTTATTLLEYRQYMNIPTDTELYFVVYRSDALDGTYTKVAENVIPSSGTGEGFYSSGTWNVSLSSGQYYYMGVSWGAVSATYFRSTETVPISASFGSLASGSPTTRAGFPPVTDFVNTSTSFPPYYCAVKTGVGYLSVAPASGTVAPGQSTSATVTVNSNALQGGDYPGGIIINSNDPFTPQTTLPVRLKVLKNVPVISVSPDAVVFDTLLAGSTTTRQLEITNLGNATLTVSSISSSDSLVSPTPDSLVIDPLATQTVTLRFSPILPGSYSATLTIISNDSNRPEVTVTMSGTVLGGPVLTLPIADVSFAEDNGPVSAAADLNAVFSNPDPNTVLTFTAASNVPDIQATVSGKALMVNATANFFGEGMVSVTADDGPFSVSDTFTVTVLPVNDPPLFDSALPDLAFPEDSSATLLLGSYASDVDDLPGKLTWSAQVLGQLAAKVSATSLVVTIDSEGLASFSASPDSNGSYLVQFSVADTAGLNDTDTITVNVTAVNDSPVTAGIPDQNVLEGVSFQPLILDDFVNDPDHADSTLSWTVTGQNNLMITITPARQAILSAPDSSWNGSETIVFTVSDPGGLSDSDTAVFTVIPVNDPPALTAVPDTLVSEGDTLVIDLSATDPENNAVTYMGLNLPGFGQVTSSPNNGGQIRFSPGFEDAGTFMNISIVASDDGFPVMSDTIYFSLVVENVNRPPVLTPIQNINIPENDTLTITISASDPDANSIAFLGYNLPGFSTFIDSGNGQGSLRFTPGFGDAGEYPDIVIRAIDNGTPQLIDSTVFKLTVGNTNRNPSLAVIPDTAMNEGVLLNLAVQASDPDGNTILLSTGSGLPDFATLVINGNGVGNLRLTPGFGDGGYYPGVTVIATDNGIPQLADTVHFSLTVNNVNRAPVFADTLPHQAILEGGFFNPLLLDDFVVDPDGDSLFSWLVSGNQALQVSLDTLTSMLTVTAPDSNWFGAEMLRFSVSDSGGLSTIDTAAFVVMAVNDAPLIVTAVPDVAFPEDGAASLNLGSYAVDIDNVPAGLTWTASVLSASGTLIDNGIMRTLTPGDLVINIDPDGLAHFSSTADSNGVFTVQLTVTDPGNLSDMDTITVTVMAVNDAPVIAAIADQNVQETDTLRLLLTAYDPDGDAVAYHAPALPAFVQLETAGQLLLAPAYSDSGTYALIVIASDNGMPVLSDTARFTLRVINRNRAPAFGDTLPDRSMSEGDTLTVDFAAADSDGDALMFSTINLPPFGALTQNGNGTGSLRFLPGFNDEGIYSNIGIIVSDVTIPAASDTLRFTLVVGNVGISETLSGAIPLTYELRQNYPNPFNPSTVILVGLPETAQITLDVFNIVGQRVMRLAEGLLPAGYHRFNFDAGNLSTGVFFYRLEAPGFVSVKKMLYVR